MAGLFDDIAEFFTGDKAKKAEEEQAAQQAAIRQAAADAEARAQGQDTAAQGYYDASKNYDTQVANDMGSSAADYLKKANEAAQAPATEAARTASTAAIKDQIRMARTSGINRGQSAILGGQAAGDQYGRVYQGQLQSGRDQYGQNIAQRAALGAQQFNQGATRQGFGLQERGLGQGYQGMAQQGANQQAQNANGDAAAGGSTLGGALGAVGTALNSVPVAGSILAGVLSDETQKENVTSPGQGEPTQELAENVKPVDFNYKESSGEDPSKPQSGVMAQDIEKTSMKNAVEETPKGKMLNTDKMVAEYAGYMSDMAREIIDLKRKLKALNGE